MRGADAQLHTLAAKSKDVDKEENCTIQKELLVKMWHRLGALVLPASATHELLTVDQNRSEGYLQVL